MTGERVIAQHHHRVGAGVVAFHSRLDGLEQQVDVDPIENGQGESEYFGSRFLANRFTR